MGSHSVTCHPAEVTFPPLPQPIKAGARFSDPRGMQGWVDRSIGTFSRGMVNIRKNTPVPAPFCLQKALNFNASLRSLSYSLNGFFLCNRLCYYQSPRGRCYGNQLILAGHSQTSSLTIFILCPGVRQQKIKWQWFGYMWFSTLSIRWNTDY